MSTFQPKPSGTPGTRPKAPDYGPEEASEAFAEAWVDRDGRIMFVHSGFDAGDEVKIEEEILEVLAS